MVERLSIRIVFVIFCGFLCVTVKCQNCAYAPPCPDISTWKPGFVCEENSIAVIKTRLIDGVKVKSICCKAINSCTTQLFWCKNFSNSHKTTEESFTTHISRPSCASGCSPEWIPFHFDSSPSKNGIRAGLFSPSISSFIGRATVNGELQIGRLQISHPIGLFYSIDGSTKFTNTSIEYLKRSNYTWKKSSFGELVKNAVTVTASRNLPFYIGRIQVNGLTFIGTVVRVLGLMYYGDENGNERMTDCYEVLTCGDGEISGAYEIGNEGENSVDGVEFMTTERESVEVFEFNGNLQENFETSSSSIEISEGIIENIRDSSIKPNIAQHVTDFSEFTTDFFEISTDHSEANEPETTEFINGYTYTQPTSHFPVITSTNGSITSFNEDNLSNVQSNGQPTTQSTTDSNQASSTTLETQHSLIFAENEHSSTSNSSLSPFSYQHLPINLYSTTDYPLIASTNQQSTALLASLSNHSPFPTNPFPNQSIQNHSHPSETENSANSSSTVQNPSSFSAASSTTMASITSNFSSFPSATSSSLNLFSTLSSSSPLNPLTSHVNEATSTATKEPSGDDNENFNGNTVAQHEQSLSLNVSENLMANGNNNGSESATDENFGIDESNDGGGLLGGAEGLGSEYSIEESFGVGIGSEGGINGFLQNNSNVIDFVDVEFIGEVDGNTENVGDLSTEVSKPEMEYISENNVEFTTVKEDFSEITSIYSSLILEPVTEISTLKPQGIESENSLPENLTENNESIQEISEIITDTELISTDSTERPTTSNVEHAQILTASGNESENSAAKENVTAESDIIFSTSGLSIIDVSEETSFSYLENKESMTNTATFPEYLTNNGTFNQENLTSNSNAEHSTSELTNETTSLKPENVQLENITDRPGENLTEKETSTVGYELLPLSTEAVVVNFVKNVTSFITENGALVDKTSNSGINLTYFTTEMENIEHNFYESTTLTDFKPENEESFNGIDYSTENSKHEDNSTPGYENSINNIDHLATEFIEEITPYPNLTGNFSSSEILSAISIDMEDTTAATTYFSVTEFTEKHPNYLEISNISEILSYEPDSNGYISEIPTTNIHSEDTSNHPPTDSASKNPNAHTVNSFTNEAANHKQTTILSIINSTATSTTSSPENSTAAILESSATNIHVTHPVITQKTTRRTETSPGWLFTTKRTTTGNPLEEINDVDGNSVEKGDPVDEIAESLGIELVKPEIFECVPQWYPLPQKSTILIDGVEISFPRSQHFSYIGRIHSSNSFIPGRIDLHSQNHRTFSFYKNTSYQISSTDNVSYLSRTNLQKYSWISSLKGAAVSNAIAINQAGMWPFYIGRVKSSTEMLIGKVLPSIGLMYFDKYGIERSAMVYEVLTCESVINEVKDEKCRV